MIRKVKPRGKMPRRLQARSSSRRAATTLAKCQRLLLPSDHLTPSSFSQKYPDFSPHSAVRISCRPCENSAAHQAQPQFRDLWACGAEKIAKIRSPGDHTEHRIEFSHGLLDFCTSGNDRSGSNLDPSLGRRRMSGICALLPFGGVPIV